MLFLLALTNCSVFQCCSCELVFVDCLLKRVNPRPITYWCLAMNNVRKESRKALEDSQQFEPAGITTNSREKVRLRKCFIHGRCKHAGKSITTTKTYLFQPKLDCFCGTYGNVWCKPSVLVRLLREEYDVVVSDSDPGH